MSKRTLDNEEDSRVVSAKTGTNNTPLISKDTEMDVDADQFSGDDFVSDGEIIEIDDEIDDENMDDEEFNNKVQEQAANALAKDEETNNDDTKNSKGPQLYMPNISRPLGPDEVLEPDMSVYEMLHNVNLPWPSLTLDIIPDELGSERRNYPQSILMTTASQAQKKKENELMVLQLSQLVKTQIKDEDDEEDQDDYDEDAEPILEDANISLKDTTNRIRVSPFATTKQEVLTAAMCENGEVNIFDIAPQSRSFSTPGYQVPKGNKRPIHTIRNHGNVEGYGLDWSPLIKTGALLTGDCSGQIYLTQRHTSKWVTDKQPFTVGNNKSIEDIQWSYTESTVFATAGCDGYIRIWDTRSKKHKPAISTKASNVDINVISWNQKMDYLLASGDDKGTWGVWDLRQFSPSNETSCSPVAQYDFHKGAITAIQFNPLDESIVAVASEDNTVTLWDLSVEADDEEIKQQRQEANELEQIPPQLLFVHWQKEVKDVKWHKQIPGCLVSTGADGLNVWKTISV